MKDHFEEKVFLISRAISAGILSADRVFRFFCEPICDRKTCPIQEISQVAIVRSKVQVSIPKVR